MVSSSTPGYSRAAMHVWAGRRRGRVRELEVVGDELRDALFPERTSRVACVDADQVVWSDVEVVTAAGWTEHAHL